MRLSASPGSTRVPKTLPYARTPSHVAVPASEIMLLQITVCPDEPVRRWACGSWICLSREGEGKERIGDGACDREQTIYYRWQSPWRASCRAIRVARPTLSGVDDRGETLNTRQGHDVGYYLG